MGDNFKSKIVLCVSGFDPSGGAGLQADIETVTASGARAVCAMTCNTIQDGSGVQAVFGCENHILRRQLQLMTKRFNIGAVKIGLIPTQDSALTIYEELRALHKPLVTDPVHCDGNGRPLNKSGALRHIRNHLLPITTLTTPNLAEVMALVPEADNHRTAAQTLVQEGCRHVLVTSAQAHNDKLEHLLVSGAKETVFTTPYLPHRYHGSGCTLSAAIAACLAHGLDVEAAIRRAQEMTWNALNAADCYNGQNQRFPNRRACQ